MPRPRKPAHLTERKRKGRKAVWVIKDGVYEESTGTGSRIEAEKALNRYLTRKETPVLRDGDAISVDEVLAAYGDGRGIEVASPERIGYAISALLGWWSGRAIADVSPATCKAYTQARRNGEVRSGKRSPRAVGDGTIRRELSCLRSAMRWCKNNGYLTSVPSIWLPEKPAEKDRWLTRDEVAALIHAARSNPETKYLARFILTALYTGSRKGIVLNLGYKPDPNAGHVDLKNGLLHRKANSARRTKKQAPTIVLPSRLSSHLRRWSSDEKRWVINKRGAKLAGIKNDWDRIRDLAGLPDVTPHTLRHTAITWAMQAGANIWHVSGYFGVSLDTLEKTYAHHHPSHMQTAVAAANALGKRAA